MRKIIKCLGFGVLSLIVAMVVGLGTYDVNADEIKTSFAVTPPHQNIVLTPGEIYRGSIKISSKASSNTDTYYEVMVGSFSEKGSVDTKDDYGTVDATTKTSYNQLMDWITIDNPEGIVSPNENDIVSFTINVPEDAPAGGQYASLIVGDKTPAYTEGEGLAIGNKMQIMSIIYAEVAGETRNEGEITENSIPSFLLNGPLATDTMVQNNGNVHTAAEYILQVWPVFSDEEICTNEEDPERIVVLPETKRYNSQTCDLPMVGVFRVKQTVKIFGEESIVEKTIIVCPVWLLFIIIFVIFVVIFYFVAKAKARKKAAAAQKAEKAEKSA